MRQAPYGCLFSTKPGPHRVHYLKPARHGFDVGTLVMRRHAAIGLRHGPGSRSGATPQPECADHGVGPFERIFPNRFQPDPFLRAGVQLEVPPAGQQSFALRFDKPGGSEAVACLGADRELGLRLPGSLKAQDLEPLPVHSLDEVAAQFRAIPGARVADARLAVEVLR
jgi:hypothetical protein